MIKTLLYLFVLFLCIESYAQNNTVAIMLDGKEVLMDLNTGVILNRNSANITQPINTKNAKIHKVKPGETYYSIARANNISVAELYKLNAIDATNILDVGTSLFVKNKAVTTTVIKNTSSSRTSIYHIVNKGDTLYAIARKYRISVEELQAINALSNTNISINQRLRIK